MKDKENEQIPEFPIFESNQESKDEMEEREETKEPACNKLVRKGGGSGKILGARRKPSRADPNVMEKSAS